MSALVVDPVMAKEFLEWVTGGRPPQLTFIKPDATKRDKERIFTKVVPIPLICEYVERYGQTHNQYFTVNTPTNPKHKKPNKSDIDFVRFFHVDIDLDANEDRETGLKRIKASLTAERTVHVPKPSALVFTGNGYQALWRLSEPVPVNGNPEALEAYNRQLANLLRGDNCHNIDRILRIPGTLNIPDKKKRERGREIVPTELGGDDE